MDPLRKDLLYGLRMLGRNPGFTAVALLTLALGIGANTAIFSMVDAILLKPLVFRQPQNLYLLNEVLPKLAHLYPTVPVHAGHFAAWRRQAKSFEALALLYGHPYYWTGTGEPRRIDGSRVSANFFSTLGVQAKIGRTFASGEDEIGKHRVVVLSDALWRDAFHSDPSVIGQKMILDGNPHEILGVVPPFLFPKNNQIHSLLQFPERTALWTPAAFSNAELLNFGFDYGVIGRLREGIPPAQALAELNALAIPLAAELPEKLELRAQMTPLFDAFTGQTRKGLLILLTAVGFILLIVCVNIANLLLTRVAARTHELSIRAAVGADRFRLLRQILTESLLLGLAGGLAGIVAAFWILDALIRRAPVELPRIEEITIDGRVLLFALFLSLLSSLLFGLLPALRLARNDPQRGLRAGGRTATDGPGGGRLRNLLVSLEVSLSTVLLIGAGLLLASFLKLLQTDKGFEPENVATLDLGLPPAKYAQSADRIRFYREVLRRTEALPGVLHAGIVDQVPLLGQGNIEPIEVDGVNLPFEERPIAEHRAANPGYFPAIGIRLLAGRLFDLSDADKNTVVISERTARQVFPNQNPMGRKYWLGSKEERKSLTIVGIVSDVRSNGLENDPPLLTYRPFTSSNAYQMNLVLRSGMDAAALASAIRSEIWAVDRDVPIPPVRSMSTILDSSTGERRYQMSLVLLFGFTALLLASIGIFGVVSYSVAQRRNEMGIRLALGADSADLYGMVLRQGMRPVWIGLAAGVTLSLALGRLLSSLLFGVTPTDLRIFAGVIAVLTIVALTACYLPARRATHIDPIQALRYE